jgi:hypothetical protein
MAKKSGLSSLYEDELGFGQAPETRTEAYRKLLEPFWKNNPVAKLGFELLGGAKGIVKLIESSDPEKRKLYDKTFGKDIIGIAARRMNLPKSVLKIFKEHGAIKLFPEAVKRQEKPWVMYKTKGMGSPTSSQEQDYNEGLATLVHELTHVGDIYLAQSRVDDTISDDSLLGILTEPEEKGHPLINELDYIMKKRLSNTPYSHDTKVNQYQQGNPFYEYEKLVDLVSKIYGEDDDKWPQKIKDMLEEEEIRGDTIRSSRKAMHDPIFRKAHYGTSTPPSSIEELQELYDKPQRKKVLNDPIFREAQYELDRLKKLYKQLGSEE